MIPKYDIHPNRRCAPYVHALLRLGRLDSLVQYSKMLVSAVPQHLQCPRTRSARLPDRFRPPYPSYSVRFSENASELVVAIIGAQYKTASDVDGEARSTLSIFLESPASPPSFFEWASVTDNQEYYNLTALAYWPNKGAYDTWSSQSGFQDWWLSLDPKLCRHGWFLEVFFPPVTRFETLFNTTNTPEGSAHMGQCMSDEVQEHGYWGSMRDRLPASQTDELVGDTVAADDFRGASQAKAARVVVPGKNNLAVIRSGQDWLDTTPDERKLYLETMHPVLLKGMDFLRDKGKEVGCHSCRFMEIVDPVSLKADRDRTFGLAYFDDLSSLERWCKEHPTHLAIFGGFHQYARRLQNNVSLRVFHEVMVLEPVQQRFEYIACHPGTGMLMTYRG